MRHIEPVFRRLLVLLGILTSCSISAQNWGWTSTNSLDIPEVGDHSLNLITPTLLELTLITTRPTDPASPAWDFVGPNFTPRLPATTDFRVLSDGKPIPVTRVGFKRRPLYAPLKVRDLRIGNWLYLELAQPIGKSVEVLNPTQKLWHPGRKFQTINDPLRFNPALHVNQTGYQSDHPKQAMVGYYLGTLGELKIPSETRFQIVDSTTAKAVHEGTLKPRPDRGFTYTPAPYQQVLEADFSPLKQPGLYRLKIEGLGASYPFQISDTIAAAFARTLALGLYHQRCGTNNTLPFTRHEHAACHLAPAEIPNSTFKEAEKILAEVTAEAKKDPRHTSPELRNFAASLFPFITQGKIDVSGGHHDAGDYSKYTINSAATAHYLLFAADHFDGVSNIDNLGLPESSDGIPDILQEAKWELDFLAKLQDKDGAFYFLVYPRNRRYEDNQLPDKGDSQIVWPKNTTATAAAVAALAEAAASPVMRKHYPKAAEAYRTTALRGWALLERALAQHGENGAYQKLTHYGHEFLHQDELAWASAALFVLTGEAKFQERLQKYFVPESRDNRRWGWWPLFEAYGCAARTYVFGSRLKSMKGFDQSYLRQCAALLHETAGNHVRWARESAYGTSFPDLNKANRNAGWYFSTERAFDIAVAHQLRGSPEYLEAIVSNLNYEAGCNPVNVSYITGLGSRRQREIVHQYAQNDTRLLPPSGLPLGNIQSGFAWLHHYQKELGEIPFPPDGAQSAPYPFYDRWGDSFNTSSEFVIVDQARSLATAAFLMAQTPASKTPWKPSLASISGIPAAVAADQELICRLNLTNQAQIVWETPGHEPFLGSEFRFKPGKPGESWVEAEAMLPDGRRFFARTNFTSGAAANVPAHPTFNQPLAAPPNVRRLWHLDNNPQEASAQEPLQLQGGAKFDSGNVSWMSQRSGTSLRVSEIGDAATVTLPINAIAGAKEISIQAMIYLNSFKAFNRKNVKLLSLVEEWDASLELLENMYEGPTIKAGTKFSVPKDTIVKVLPPNQWHLIRITVNASGYTASVNGKIIAQNTDSEFANWGKRPQLKVEIGNFDGWIDELGVLVD